MSKKKKKKKMHPAPFVSSSNDKIQFTIGARQALLLALIARSILRLAEQMNYEGTLGTYVWVPDFLNLWFASSFSVFLLYYFCMYSSLPNKRTCTPYLILTKLTPCALLFGPVRLFIFGIWNFLSNIQA